MGAGAGVVGRVTGRLLEATVEVEVRPEAVVAVILPRQRHAPGRLLFFGNYGGSDKRPLPEAFALPPYVLLEEDGAELLEAGGRLVECGEDRSPFGNGEPEDFGPVEQRRIQPARKRWRDNSGELPEKSLVDRDATHQHSLAPVGRGSETPRLAQPTTLLPNRQPLHLSGSPRKWGDVCA